MSINKGLWLSKRGLLFSAKLVLKERLDANIELANLLLNFNPICKVTTVLSGRVSSKNSKGRKGKSICLLLILIGLPGNFSI